MKYGRWALGLMGVSLLVAPLQGHHSFAATYLEQELVELEGDITEFQYKNPHAWVHLAGQDGSGRPKAWAAEWASLSRLERAGISQETLKPGDNVRIWAAPNRDPNDNRVHLKRIVRRSDGWKWGQPRP